MQKRTLPELESLKRNLDIFSGIKAPAPRLLELGLYPPLPIAGDLLVWGFHILHSARAGGVESLSCRHLPGLTLSESLKIALHLEARPGNYSWVEKEKMYRLLKEAGAVSVMTELSELIEGRANPRLSAKIESFSQLPSCLKSLVNEQTLDLKTALRSRDLPESVFILLKERGRNLSFSRRKILFTWLSELAQKNKMDREEVTELLQEALQTAEPLEMIRLRRYPVLSALERKLNIIREQTLRGSGIKLATHPFFEGDSFSVSFTFESRKNLAEKTHRLADLEAKSDDLFRLLR